jgi:hypothetical protein
MAPSSYMAPVHYLRHFLLLGAFGISLAVFSRLHLLSNLDATFALYGALHAVALVLSLGARRPGWRQCLFIVLAAGLSVMTLHVGIWIMHRLGGLPGNIGLYTALGVAAWVGAVAYGISIRLCGIHRLKLRALAVIGLGCALATYAAFLTLGHFHSLGRWWLAVLWWFALSSGLWYHDRRPRF